MFHSESLIIVSADVVSSLYIGFGEISVVISTNNTISQKTILETIKQQKATFLLIEVLRTQNLELFF